ncbi:MAG: hypothetical protein PSV13_05375 [Lacunisphaera sp.]|nr:hypothetical protein [Lacunisphaera sp.]
MRNSRPRLLALTLFITPLLCAATLENDRYRLEIGADHAVTLSAKGVPTQVLQPEFTVLFSERDPGYHVNHQNYPLAPRTAVRWSGYEEELSALNPRLASPALRELLHSQVSVTADARGARTWTYRDTAGKITLRVSGAYARGTTDPFLAGKRTVLRAQNAVLAGRTLSWTFAAQAGFTISAELSLPEGDGDPRISHRLEARRAGHYSVAFSGAPSVKKDEVLTIPQETAGRGLRQFNHLVNEAYLRLPRAQLATADWSAALVVDSGEMPFRIPTRQNARFGLMMQLADDRFKPIAFAPIIGGAESHLKPGEARTFAVHYVLRPGDWKDTYVYIARALYAFRDQRDHTGPGSINAALEATMDFLADRHGGNRALWHDEQKYYDYWTDNSGIFKPFSPLFGLSAAVVTDDEEFYLRRALPQVEFALSRADNTFAPYEVAQNGQVKARNRELGRSYLSTAQLVTLSSFFQHRTPAIMLAARTQGFSESNFTDLLARHVLSGNAADLAAARRVADSELKKGLPVSQGEGYMDWLELYEVTREPRYLDAAVAGAYGLTTTINLSPAIPAGAVVVEAHDRVPVHEHSVGRHRLWGFQPPQPVVLATKTVPAWRVAFTGLQSPAYRGELWMNNHGQLMRLAAHANDDFLRDIARWGMVGRFGNYSGDNRSNYSLITERSDSVERSPWDWNFATVNPGHAWEFAGELIDFLVSDAFHRSRGAIDFPGQPMPGASFRVRVYGDRPGRFHGDENVRLWLPRQLITSDNRQIDYLAGYGNGKVYLAFWNQSFVEEAVNIVIDRQRVDLSQATSALLSVQNGPARSTPLAGQTLSFHLPPKGIAAYTISGAQVHPALQAKMLATDVPALGPDSRARAAAPFGQVYATLISLGRGLTSAHVYTDALPEEIIAATLRYRQGGGDWRELTDGIFPYEFSPPYVEKAGALELVFRVETSTQKIEQAPLITLRP